MYSQRQAVIYRVASATAANVFVFPQKPLVAMLLVLSLRLICCRCHCCCHCRCHCRCHCFCSCCCCCRCCCCRCWKYCCYCTAQCSCVACSSFSQTLLGEAAWSCNVLRGRPWEQFLSASGVPFRGFVRILLKGTMRVSRRALLGWL